MSVRVGKPPGQLDAQAEAPSVGMLIQRPPSPWRRRLIWLGVIVVAIVIGLQLTAGFPQKWVVDFGGGFERMQNWVIDHDQTNWLFVHFFTPFKNGVNSLHDQLVLVLERMTWLGVVVAAAAIAGVAAGWRMAVLAASGFLAIGFLGLWAEALETLVLMLLGVVAALAIGVPLGVWAGRRDRVNSILRPLLDAAQTIPAFSYLIPIVLLFSIGPTTALIATVIFALPPAVRLTSLGIRGVPDTIIEVAEAYGSTPGQILRKVQLPLAKPSIMLGVNQTIMMALGVVVIASLVGVGGLGRVVLDALNTLNVGEGLNGGLAIVVLAIVLDRVSFAWSQRNVRRRGETSVRMFDRTFPRWQVVVGSMLITVIAVLVGRQVLRQQDFPASWTFSVAAPTNAFKDWVFTTFGRWTGDLSDWITRDLLDPLRTLLLGVPWWMVCGGAALLAWRVSRRIGLTVMSFLCLAGVGVLGMWDISMDTLSQVAVAVALSVAFAIPLGIVAARSDRFQRFLKPILDAAQVMPAFVYLVPVIALFHVGRVPGVIAAFVYALPPCIRLTDLGIRQVPNDTVEAAESFGATPNQMLTKVQLPLARPSILLGVNQTIMMVLSVVIIAGLIGGGGLGLEVIKGLVHGDIGQGMVGGICILLLAIVIDRITQAMGMASRSMRGPVGTGGLGWWTRVRAIPAGRAARPSDDVTQAEALGKGEG
ncbi:MAG: ABC transporter permease [Actinomycetota bacterium]